MAKFEDRKTTGVRRSGTLKDMIGAHHGWLEPMRPYWVALVVLYWCLESQDRITLGVQLVQAHC